MGLPHNEWLVKAQALAVGQTRRTYHNEESRANLIVGNDHDRWWAYCHRCHEGGVLTKEHVVLQAQPVQQGRVMPWPADALPYGADSGLSQAAWRMLLPKGIDLHSMLPGVPLWTSQGQQRLLFGSAQGWLGRAIGNVQPKWVAYRSAGQHPAVYATHPADRLSGTVVLTEDYLSALKIRWATDAKVTAAACLGTSLHTRCLAQCINCERILLAFDGDEAGQRGSRAVAQRLSALGVNVQQLHVPWGLDPKDMRSDQIKGMLCSAVNLR